MSGDGSDIGGLGAIAAQSLYSARDNLRQNKINKLAENAKNNQDATHDPAELKRMRKASEDFEALLVGQMFKSMWSTLPQDGILDSKEEGMFREMLMDQLAQDTAKGQGLGIADIIFREMNKFDK